MNCPQCGEKTTQTGASVQGKITQVQMTCKNGHLTTLNPDLHPQQKQNYLDHLKNVKKEK